MKREDAETLIESEKTQQSALAQITSASAAGVWTQLKFVFASLAEWLYNQWEGFRDEIENLVNTRRWATVDWYIEKAKAFQLGDMLELQPSGQFGYTEIDPAKQIIKQAAIDVVDRELRFKVATEANGELAKVSDADMELFKSYIHQIMRPGTQIRFINYEADLLFIWLKAWFDGERIEAEVQSEIRTAVHDYLTNLVFNGVFSVTALIDRIQQVPGITECVWIDGESWQAPQTSADAVSIIDRHKAASGYFKIALDEEDEELLQIDLEREF